jgi:REDY-like protein HapK
MTRIVVLFRLKADTDRAAYEAWAKNVDAPTVNGLSSVERFTVHRCTGLLGSDSPAPYDYVEVLDVRSMEGLIADISTEAMGAIAAQFQAFADNPTFILTERLA